MDKTKKRGQKNMTKIILSIFITLLALSPNKVEANQAGVYENAQDIKVAPRQTKDDYYWYDEEFNEIILLNDRLEPDQNSSRDFLIKNRENLNRYDLMELDFLNSLATGDREQTINTLVDIIGRLNNDIINQKNNDLLHIQRWYTFHLYNQVHKD